MNLTNKMQHALRIANIVLSVLKMFIRTSNLLKATHRGTRKSSKGNYNV